MDPGVRSAAVRRIVEHASRQHQVVTTAQLAGCGLTRHTAATLRSDGWLTPIRPGAHLVGGREPSDWQKVVAAALVVGREAVMSHSTAARVHQLPHLAPTPAIELTVVMGRHPRLQGVDVHRVARLEPADVQPHRGLVATTPARTLCDLASRLPRGLLERVLDGGLVDRLWTPESVGQAIERGGIRPGIGTLRQLIMARREEGHVDTTLEQRAVRILAPFRPFETQYQVVLDGQVYVLDIAWPLWKVAVECDGFTSHGASRERFDRDRRLGNLLLAHGWALARYTSAMTDRQLLSDVGRLLPARISGSLSRRAG